ncbi:hypothetical protein HHK36_004296 [Tetracentron sinense]|uniref:Uncharacterized protein n=1 Tax=Tetracentron sinense TaxID=13715 RepID=A0A835DQ31_TETSI|nr:hypothetical protein HHK36_004296 [Tetracentron sinense]
MELPECPVCLQVYNNEETIPRVLSCGHSACEACLTLLPQRFPNTIRCPACNQLVLYPPHPHGPSALPKNIDLLRFIHQQHPFPNPNPNSSQPLKTINPTSSQPQFLPRLWSEDFYSNWKDWILPMDSVSVEEMSDDLCSVFQGRITSFSSPSPIRLSCFRENQMVSLVRVASSFLSDPASAFNFSYVARIMEALNRMDERGRDELGSIVRALSRQFRVCKVYGLWMNSEDGCIFLVCERFQGNLLERLNESRNGVAADLDGLTDEKLNWGIEDGMLGIAMAGMELFEAVIGFHSEGLVSGCLALSCFRFDDFGRIYADPNEILVTGRRVRKCIAEATSEKRISDYLDTEVTFTNLLKTQAFVSPEVLFELLYNESIVPECGSLGFSVGYGSDVWSLACILVRILIGNPFTEELFRSLHRLFSTTSEENRSERLDLYMGWMEKVSSALGNILGTKFASLQHILCRCLSFDPESRPLVTDAWRCIRELVIKPHVDILASVKGTIAKENAVHCLILGELCHLLKETENKSESQEKDDSSGADVDQVGEMRVNRDLFEGMSVGTVKSIDLQGHLDCITGLAVGGGFLFSSSSDKTVHVWSLQDFAHLQSLRGHEHRVMAVVFVDEEQPLCISGDSGGGIFVWGIGLSLGQEPLQKWYEQKDWRYTGIHALTVSGTEYLYTGSGDKSIKAWSLRDYTLTCTMNGHKSVVSTLAVCDGILYSGSWDGTIRLWCLNDHSPLTVLGDVAPGNMASVLSLSVDSHMLVAAHENGFVKIWRHDVLVRSTQTRDGAIFALGMEGKWIFMGGWNKTVYVQELAGDDFEIDTRSVGSIACDSVITALLYWQGKLFVGFADKVIKMSILYSRASNARHRGLSNIDFSCTANPSSL